MRSLVSPALAAYTRRWAGRVVWGLVGLALAACATPEHRIQRNRALFDALPAPQQVLIRNGKVSIGFTPDMVRLAVGDPDRRWVRTDAAGQSEIWTYITEDSGMDLPPYRSSPHRYYGDSPFGPGEMNLAETRPREYFKVTFRDGLVTVVEQDAR